MKVTFLGTGTSHGIPVLTCDCSVCNSIKRENTRLRSSLLIETSKNSIIIDTTPEFRIQAIREKISRIDAVFYTHTHADHLHGIDDLRPYSTTKSLPLYCGPSTRDEIRERFPYIFGKATQKGGGIPQLLLEPITKKTIIDDIEITPIPVKHGILDIYGYRINNVAYITDCSYIPSSSYSLLKDLDVLIIGALRYRKHSTHFNIDEAVIEIEKINPKRAFLTHICHDVDHFKLINELEDLSKKDLFIKKIKPAHDGLCLKLD